ncbi:unnamed protein product [Cuscuta campestris]|uniref:Pentacotripeptide-repeat region of PRORP domain-containing protein n=1 Tax=Cuscuta campestris TaxID=132261 RepID=A0A484LTK8_9ASTE|nr:unnamed protein product [Cuscuta campestris]
MKSLNHSSPIRQCLHRLHYRTAFFSSSLSSSRPPPQHPFLSTDCSISTEEVGEVPHPFSSEKSDSQVSQGETTNTFRDPCNSSSQPSSENSETRLVEILLGHRDDPESAFKHFKHGLEQVDFQRGSGVPLYVLLHILVCSSEHQHMARSLILKHVLEDSGPTRLVFDSLADCAKRFSFELSPVVFNGLLYSLSKARRLLDAIDCFKGMLDHDILIQPFLIGKVLKMLVRNKMIREAKALLSDAVCRGIAYGTFTVRLMMLACVKEGDAELAERYFLESKASGITHNEATYSVAVHTACRLGKANTAIALLNEMKEKSWVPSEGTYTNVICACVKQMNMVDALRIKDEMVSCGRSVGLVVMTSLMKGYCVQGDVSSALGLLDHVVEGGLSPNKATYAVLIEGCCNKGHIEKALELHTQMKLAGIQPSVYTENSLLRGFLKANLLDEATKQFEQVVATDVANAFTYNAMLSWYCKKGKTK